MEFICDKKRHLVCIPYSVENLHKMADVLGIKRCWYEKGHYDIPKRRVKEIMELCKIVSSKQIVNIMKKKKKKIILPDSLSYDERTYVEFIVEMGKRYKITFGPNEAYLRNGDEDIAPLIGKSEKFVAKESVLRLTGIVQMEYTGILVKM